MTGPAAVATSREGHRLPTASQAFQDRRLGPGTDAGEALAISMQLERTRVLERFQERMPLCAVRTGFIGRIHPNAQSASICKPFMSQTCSCPPS
jgi:hypothetical protein